MNAADPVAEFWARELVPASTTKTVDYGDTDIPFGDPEPQQETEKQ